MFIRFYKSSSGREPVKDYILSLPDRDKRDVFASIDDIRTNDLKASTVIFRPIKGYPKLWEIKIFSAASHRIFYCMLTRKEMVLLHALKKKSQKTPENDLSVAYARLKEVML